MPALLFAAAQVCNGQTMAVIGAQNQKWRAVFEHCAPATAVDKLDSLRTITYRVVEWTGGCVDGLRDGFGRITDRYDDTHPDVWSKPSNTNITEGTLVRGKTAGLWCQIYYENAGGFPLGCWLADGDTGSSDRFHRTPDGNWEVIGSGGTRKVSAAEMVRSSAELVTKARSGSHEQVILVTTSSALDDLVRGGRIVVVPGKDPLGLKDSRVAVVLSTRSVSEFKRFDAMRQRFVDMHRGEKERDRFLKASDPRNFTAAIIWQLKGRTKQVVAAEDLGVLREGSADYVLVIDWRFEGDFALNSKQYASMPACPDSLILHCPVPLFRQAATVWLVDAKLQAVRSGQLTSFEFGYEAIKPKEDRKAGYRQIVADMAQMLEWGWNVESGTSVSVLSTVILFNP